MVYLGSNPNRNNGHIYSCYSGRAFQDRWQDSFVEITITDTTNGTQPVLRL
jgi:hypothetical protein